MITFPSHEFSKSHVMIRAKIITAFDTQTRTNLKYSSWINYYIPTLEYCSAIKRKKLLIHTITWVNSERITLS